MSIEQLLLQLGLPIVFLASMVEGEATLILAGFLAHRGFMPLAGVIVMGALGSFAADQFWYQLGRRQGAAYLAKRPGWQRRIDQVLPWLTRFGAWLVVGFRFLFGVRSIIAFGFGMSQYPVYRFAPFNLLGALIWAAITTALGYYFGQAVEPWIGRVKNIEFILIGIVVLLSLAYWLWQRNRQHNRQRGQTSQPHPRA